MQINNLKIKYDWRTGEYQVIAPDKSLLAVFYMEGNAIDFARKTLDFRKIARYQDK